MRFFSHAKVLRAHANTQRSASSESLFSCVFCCCCCCCFVSFCDGNHLRNRYTILHNQNNRSGNSSSSNHNASIRKSDSPPLTRICIICTRRIFKIVTIMYVQCKCCCAAVVAAAAVAATADVFFSFFSSFCSFTCSVLVSVFVPLKIR